MRETPRSASLPRFFFPLAYVAASFFCKSVFESFRERRVSIERGPPHFFSRAICEFSRLRVASGRLGNPDPEIRGVGTGRLFWLVWHAAFVLIGANAGVRIKISESGESDETRTPR